MSESIAVARPRFRLRFGVRLLLSMIVVIAGALGYVTRRARLQQRAIDAVRSVQGEVRFADDSVNGNMRRFDEPPGPRWLRDQLGDDCFRRVTAVRLVNLVDDSVDYHHLPHLKGLRELALGRSNRGAGDELAPLAQLSDLEGLILDVYGVDDVGLSHVARLPKLWYLKINGAQLTDAGAIHFGRMRSLRVLELDNMGFTDAGLSGMENLDKLKELRIGNVPIRGPGLAHLARLPHLERLILFHTQVGDNSLEYVAQMPGLRFVGLHGTRVTADGVARLQAARPDLQIGWEPRR